MLANKNAAAVLRALRQCFDGIEPLAPWQWQCTTQNGSLLRVRASLAEGFLHLDCPSPAVTEPVTETDCEFISRALLRNASLPAGVGLALGSRNDLRLSADIALLDESLFLSRIDSVLAGFHHALAPFTSSDPAAAALQPSHGDPAPATILAERLRDCGWPSTERGPSEFSSPLDATSAPPATIRLTGDSVVFAAELARLHPAARASHQAIAAFLLTTCGSLRLVRACAAKDDDHTLFALQVSLPVFSAAGEFAHGLAALSFAFRLCSRETAFLLDEPAASRYLAAREFPSTTSQLNEEKYP